MLFKISVLFLSFTCLILTSCTEEEEIPINGIWNLKSKQCEAFSYAENVRLILIKNDSLGNSGLLIRDETDTLLFDFYWNKNQTILTLTSEQADPWINSHKVTNLQIRRLDIKIKESSCMYTYRFIK